MPSIPPLLGGKMRRSWPAHPLWVTNRLMAALADADEVALALPFCVHIENIQGQLRPSLHVVDVMDQIGPTISAPGFAYLAFMAI